jgi:hypothetical protein
MNAATRPTSPIAHHPYIAVPYKVQKYATMMGKQQQALQPLLEIKAAKGLTPAQEKRVQRICNTIEGYVQSMAKYLCLKAA